MPNPRISKYGANEEIARKRLAEAILLKYIELQKNKEFANVQVFSPECQIELNKFDEYMECVRNNQLKANGYRENKKDEIRYPISLYVEKMIKQKKKQSEYKGVKKKKKISPKTVTYYWRTAKTQVLPYFGDFDATTITQEQIIMGHADFDTTRKYYIHITEERKRNEMLKLYRQQNSEPELQKLIEENDKYFNNVIKIRIQDIRPEKKLAS